MDDEYLFVVEEESPVRILSIVHSTFRRAWFHSLAIKNMIAFTFQSLINYLEVAHQYIVCCSCGSGLVGLLVRGRLGRRTRDTPLMRLRLRCRLGLGSCLVPLGV
jgi:hypothetical protein